MSLFFRDGVAAPTALVGTTPRYVQELDILVSASSEADEGIAPLLASDELRGLSWRGVRQVEETWNASLDGTFTRQRFYRGAKWMEQPSHFKLTPIDANGQSLGDPLLAHAGSDDREGPNDDGFVRRFVARQIATGCSAVGDCEGATYVAEALVQLRGALDADGAAVVIPEDTAALALTWSADPEKVLLAPTSYVPRADAPYGYGFAVELEAVSPPALGFYLPGEAVALRVTFKDGEGNRLHPVGALPTYGEFVRGEVESGLRYLDIFGFTPSAYYALKHRESNLLVTLSGPTDALRTPQSVVPAATFFLPQVTFASEASDGFTSVGQTVPAAPIIFGGLANPAIWEAPVSDVVVFTLPHDVEPGTYVASIKARRDYGGEALNRGATLSLQVGSTAPTVFTAATTCTACHAESAKSFAGVLHGLDDRRSCFGCHSALDIELDNALDVRVHMIHDRSDRFPRAMSSCTLCHLSAPASPARGLLE